MKNFSDSIGNPTPDLPACSAVPQPTAPQRAPFTRGRQEKMYRHLRDKCEQNAEPYRRKKLLIVKAPHVMRETAESTDGFRPHKKYSGMLLTVGITGENNRANATQRFMHCGCFLNFFPPSLPPPLPVFLMKTDVINRTILNVLFTPWSWGILERLTDPQIVREFPGFYGTCLFVTSFTTARLLSLSWFR
jgi:hypothetical protein